MSPPTTGARPWPLLLPLAVAAAGLLLTTLALLGDGAPGHRGGDDGTVAARDALVRGNRLARRGELEAAVEAYSAGWPGAADEAATLAYNLGSSHHRLGRLPEAVLWYRRAARRAPGDRWIADNLDLARTELAASRLGPATPTARIAAHPAWPATLAVLLAWVAGALYLARRPLARQPLSQRLPPALADHAWTVPALLALALWSAVLALSVWGPRPAVLLDPCVAADTRLEPGSEVWVTRVEDGWAVSGGPPELVCGDAAVGLVDQG